MSWRLEHVAHQAVDQRSSYSSPGVATPEEDLLEVGQRRVLREHLVADAAEERFVEQLGRGGYSSRTPPTRRNGTTTFWPVCSARKSTWLSSGVIQRFSMATGEHFCLPKSSMISRPPFAVNCSGAW
jgi:hypothetical protein